MGSDQKEYEELLARCALKDQSALKKLFDNTSGYLNAIANRMLKSDELANDVLQEAFIQIWENAGRYQPGLGKPLTWMTSIVRYRSLDLIEKQKRYGQKFISSDDYDDIIDSVPDDINDNPETTLVNASLLNDITVCLNEESNENVRQSIKLAYLEGFSREEIANCLKANVNTVKSWLHRGSERLKLCMAKKR